MLWYRAWLETRIRFLISLTGITAICAYVAVYRGLRFVIPSTPVRYFYNLLHLADDTLCVLWIASVTLLAMGGLLREKAAGTSSFTLSLPVSRRRLVGVRIGVVLLEAMILIVVPWGVVIAMIGTGAKPQLLAQAWFYIALLAGGGSLFVAMPILVSSIVEGEYTAPAIGFGLVLALVFGFPDSFRMWDPVVFVRGDQWFNRDSGMLSGPIPWGHVAATMCVAALLLAISVKAIEKREF